MEIVQIDQAPFRAKAKEVAAKSPKLERWYTKMTAQ